MCRLLYILVNIITIIEMLVMLIQTVKHVHYGILRLVSLRSTCYEMITCNCHLSPLINWDQASPRIL